MIEDIQEKLCFRKKNVFRKSFVRKNLSYVVRSCEDKLQTLLYMLDKVPGSVIVYVRNRKRTQELAAFLRQEGKIGRAHV